MAYRDPAAAARERVRQARAEVERHEERLTPELLAQLDVEGRDALQEAASKVDAALGDSLEKLDRDALLRSLPLLADYEAKLTKAIAAAPRLAKEYNRLPRTFPKRRRTKFFYQYMDIYAAQTAGLRRRWHERILGLDPDAALISARSRYDDEMEDPFLVEAELTVERAPLRLQVQGLHANTTDRTGIGSLGIALFVRTRPSTPSLRIELQGLDDRLLKWLRLKDEPSIGHEAFDDAYFIHGTEQDARRLLRPDVHEPLLRLAHGRRVELETGDGLASLQWLADAEGQWMIDPAIATMIAVRNTPPVRLLRRERSSTSG
ncbi:MAG TPA: hypothetical protein ENK57_09725 [Polyangiaceae bacterium]|nr:hypothetical protein [Polyangiaceae bacterium]